MKSFLLQDWKFSRKDAENAYLADYNDDNWADVAVPHDWSVVEPFSREHSSGTGYLPGGVGWYRARFNFDGDAETVFLNFDGVYKNARVWINGNYLGKRPNGYIGFKYDISSFIKEENFVAVRVEHNDIADSRWFTGSGIYRKVTVTAHKGAYIADNSVIFTFDGENATVKAHVCGELSVPLTVTLGDYRQEATTPDINITIPISSPKLWSVDAPDLYDLTFTNGGEPLCKPLKVGLRTFRFDADEGFFLNGENIKLRGVCVHHDAGCLGAAVYSSVWRDRLIKLKEMGCNAIRGSHNPQMPELCDLCDELGLVMMVEAVDDDAFIIEHYKNRVIFKGKEEITVHLKGQTSYITLKPNGITIETVGDTVVKTAGNTTIQTGGEMSLMSSGSMSLTAGGNVNIKGSKVFIN